MVVVAHPDDAEWGCAGTVAKWCADGWEVVYILCTDGGKGSDDFAMTSKKLVEIRTQEQLSVAELLGLHKVVFLGYEDAMLRPTLELRRDITRQIRRYRPDVLICMNPTRRLIGEEGYLGHPDHFASAEAALSAVFPAARDRLTFPELLQEGLEPHNVREAWIMGHEDPDQFVDVTLYIDIAVEALKRHQSQVGAEADQHMRQWRRRVGEKAGFQYAEAFKSFHLG
jgi:LmbE family N-acetylglucosaminyl deacetylase